MKENETEGRTPVSSKIELDMPGIIVKKGSQLMDLDKEGIRALVKPLQKFLQDKEITYSERTPGSTVSLMNKFLDKTISARLLKQDLAKVYEAFTSDCSNVYAVAQPGTPEGKCWEHILRSIETDSDELNKILGRDIVVEQTRYWSGRQYPECMFYPLWILDRQTQYRRGNWTEYRYRYIFSIGPSSREKLATLYFGKESVEPQISRELPDSENLRIIDFESYIPSDLTYLAALGMTGNPLSGTKGTVPAARMKTIRKNFNTGIFSISPTPYPMDRVELLVYSFFSVAFDNKKGTGIMDPGAFARNIVSRLPQLITGPQFSMFLPEFKGFTKSWTEYSNVGSVTNAVASILKPSAEGWMSLSNLWLRFLCCGLSEWFEYPYNSLFTRQSRSRNMLRRVSDNLGAYEISKNIDWFEEIDFPFVIHWMRFLCAVGILELAVDPDAGPEDALEGIRYVRLTALGRYAYSIDNEYMAPSGRQSCQLEFDDSNLIVTVLSNDCPYALFLQQVSTPIGTSRFKITPTSILKGCGDEKEAVSRIENLKKIVDIEACPNLNATIKEALSRTKCVEKAPKSYSIRKISREAPGFAEFLASDKSIREHCLFAENSLILIEKSFLPEFKAICSRNGYLVDLLSITTSLPS